MAKPTTINGNNAGAGVSSVNGNGAGAGSTIFKTDLSPEGFKGVASSGWPYVIGFDQRLKSFASAVSASDYLAYQLFFDPTQSVAGIASFSDFASYVAGAFPNLKYGCAAAGSEIMLSADRVSLGEAPLVNFQPRWNNTYPIQVYDGLPAADIIETLTNAGTFTGYNLQLVNLYHTLPRQVITQHIQDVVTNLGRAGNDWLFIDDFTFGLLHSGVFDSTTYAAMPAWLAQVRDACHAVGKRMIPNVLNFQNWIDSPTSKATGAASDALMHEFTYTDGGVPALMNFGSPRFPTHFAHAQAAIAGGALIIYLGTPNPSGGGPSYTSMLDFETALCMMLGNALCYRDISAVATPPASANWPAQLGQRVGQVTFNASNDVATCQFEHGTLQADSTHYTATKL